MPNTVGTSIGTFGKEWRLWRALIQQFMNTAGGNSVQLAVTNGATSVTYTFGRTDTNANYGVVATPTWSTTVYCSARTTTSLTLTFGTAAGANATVDIITFRG